MAGRLRYPREPSHGFSGSSRGPKPGDWSTGSCRPSRLGVRSHATIRATPISANTDPFTFRQPKASSAEGRVRPWRERHGAPEPSSPCTANKWLPYRLAGHRKRRFCWGQSARMRRGFRYTCRRQAYVRCCVEKAAMTALRHMGHSVGGSDFPKAVQRLLLICVAAPPHLENMPRCQQSGCQTSQPAIL